MSKKKAKHDLPRTVFVQRYKDNDSNYLLAYGEEREILDADDLGENTSGEVVGIYELKEVVRIIADTTYKRERIG